MAETTKIQWCDHTFNPWRGCSKVASGCTNCYAEKNVGVKLHGIKWGTEEQGGMRVVTAETYWRDPIKWDRRAASARVIGRAKPRVFCASLADVFEDWQGLILNYKGEAVHRDSDGHFPVTMDDCRARLFRTIDKTPNLDWLLLTKRPGNVRRMWPMARLRENVWLGTSIANQEDADRNIPELLKCRDLAGKLFLSIEPMVGPVDLEANKMGVRPWHDEPWLGVDWVIVGGESGPNARPCNIDWISSIVRQCEDAGVACFVKQIGARPTYFDDGGMTGAELPDAPYQSQDPKGGDPAEWPEDLRIRQLPSLPGGRDSNHE